MKTTFLYLFNLVLATSIHSQNTDFQSDSLLNLTEKQCISGAIDLYSSTNQEAFFELARTQIETSGERHVYATAKLYLAKATSFQETEIDSSNYYLNKVNTDLDADSSISLSYAFTRVKGMSYLFDGQYINATKEFIKNVDLCNSKDDKKRLSMTYSDIAIPNFYMENYAEAINFWELSANIALELEDYNTLFEMYLNIALTYSQSGDKVSAKNYKDICISLTKNKPLNIDKTTFYLNMGVIDYNIEDYISAIQLFKTASQFALEADDLNSYSKSITNISACYIEQKNPEKGIDFLNEVLYNTTGTLEPKYKSSLYKMLGEAYSGTKNYKNGYIYLDSAYVLKQELLNESRTEQLAEMQEKYHSVQKDKKIVETEFAYNLEKSEKEQEQLKSAIRDRQQVYLYFGLALLTLFTAFMYNRFRITRKQKRIIELQQLKTEKQKRQIEQQHLELEVSHKEISDSIKYAERLQLAILPSQENLRRNLDDGFVYFQPKDVVSGDFYWSIQLDNKVYFAAADCTGHGVPGAMVSVVCSNALNRSVKEFALRTPAEILDKARELVIETFARSGTDVKDGMDICLCSIENNKLEFAGANNSLWIIRKTISVTKNQLSERSTQSMGSKSIIEIKADRQPIGLYEGMTPFNNHTIDLYPDDKIYLFTDGYADQFGGPKGKKMKYTPFKLFLLQIEALPMTEQKIKLEEQFKSWKGKLDQIDDVCIIGVHLK